MNACKECKTEKRHKCTNIAQLQTIQILMAVVLLRHFRFTILEFQAAWFLLDWVYMLTDRSNIYLIHLYVNIYIEQISNCVCVCVCV